MWSERISFSQMHFQSGTIWVLICSTEDVIECLLDVCAVCMFIFKTGLKTNCFDLRLRFHWIIAKTENGKFMCFNMLKPIGLKWVWFVQDSECNDDGCLSCAKPHLWASNCTLISISIINNRKYTKLRFCFHNEMKIYVETTYFTIFFNRKLPYDVCMYFGINIAKLELVQYEQ